MRPRNVSGPGDATQIIRLRSRTHLDGDAHDVSFIDQVRLGASVPHVDSVGVGGEGFEAGKGINGFHRATYEVPRRGERIG